VISGGFVGVADYALSSTFAVGLWPRYLVNVQGSSDVAAAKALDLRVRVLAAPHLARNVQIYATGAIGYAIIFLPSDPGGANPTGLTLTFGAGGLFALQPRVAFYTELAGELGYESHVTAGFPMGLRVNYDNVSVGVGLRFTIDGSP
jgi:hypothetical protein